MKKFLQEFKRLTNQLLTRQRSFWNKPYLLRDPDTYDKRPPLEDIYATRLGEMLQIGAPQFLEQWRSVVLYSAYKVKQHEDAITALVSKKEAVAKRVGQLEAEQANPLQINHSPDDALPTLKTPPEPQPFEWEKILTVGLSLMLFLGLSEMLGLDLTTLRIQEDWLKLTVAVAGAVCMNIAEYESIYRIVIALRRFEPHYIYSQDERYPSPIPFWHRFKSGDPAVWISLTFILLETLFAFLGLINLLLPRQQEQLVFQLSILAAAGLAATINLSLAWGNALTRVQWERIIEDKEQAHQQILEEIQQGDTYRQQQEQYWAREKELEQKQQNTAKQLGEAQAELRETIQQLQALEKDLPDLKARALLEHERWEFDVRKWMRENPTKVENFKQLYPHWHQEMNSMDKNGHRSSQQLSILSTNDVLKLDED